MKQRIQELAVQAGLYAELNGCLYPSALSAEKSNDAYKKFAELIVQECADTVLGFHNQFGDSAHAEIRTHFGVE